MQSGGRLVPPLLPLFLPPLTGFPSILCLSGVPGAARPPPLPLFLRPTGAFSLGTSLWIVTQFCKQAAITYPHGEQAYPKYVFTLDSLLPRRNGILHLNLVEFMAANQEL